MQFSYGCAAVNKISTGTERHASVAAEPVMKILRAEILATVHDALYLRFLW